ncbi:transferase family-domain-containing protein [Colletotrichum cereale]|nr:transferase family-domain-containing protein [Colletotrichum cereale]
MSGTLFPPVVTLGPLDQIAPRIYVRTVFVFEINRDFEIGTALGYIANRFWATLRRWPFLTGQIRPASYPTRPNELELQYCFDEDLADPAQRPDIFAYQSYGGFANYSYGYLKEHNMPPTAMNKDVLSLSPDHPKPGESCPPVTLKVTRIRDGALMLCFATHHAIFDGGFIKTFLEFFGQGFESTVPPETFIRECKNRPTMRPYERTRIKNTAFPEYDFTPNTDLASDVNGHAMGNPDDAPEVICTLFKISNQILQMLHGNILVRIRHAHGPEAYVTVVDTLSALIWVYVTRARSPRLDLDEKTSFTTAVNARARLSPCSFPADAWGNIYTQTSANGIVGDLVQMIGSNMARDTTPSIAAAAWLIREAVDQVSSPGYVPSRIALAASLPDPTMEGAAFRKALQPDRAGLGCSVWLHMGADVDFGIPGTGGVADYVRKTWSKNEGSMNIMQRRGVTKGDAPWEVLLSLREEDMLRLCEPAELGAWVSSMEN